MDFTGCPVLRAIIQVDDAVHRPISNQPAVKLHFVGAVGGRTRTVEGINECACGHIRNSLPV